MGKTVGYIRKNKLIPMRVGEDYSELEPVYSDSIHGKYIIRHSLIMLLRFIVNSMFDESELKVEHTVSGGLYCEIYSNVLISSQDIENINKKLGQIIEKDEELESRYKTRDELMEIFADDKEKKNLMKYSNCEGAFYCNYHNIEDFFHTPLVASTGMLQGAYLKYYPPGIIIYHDEKFEKEKQEKLFNIFLESEKWAKILGWEKVDRLNKSTKSKDLNQLIHVAEALHEKKIVDIANLINERRGELKLITIAGPSSSGKTTFLKRLAVQLRVLGISVMGVSLDDYFVDREKTPIDENGEPDFEAIESIDLELFNSHVGDLITGKEVHLPEFDFQTGKRKFKKKLAKIDKNTIIIIEGIHGLNERLTEGVPKSKKLKIYVSALTQINLDHSHRISTTDNRLMRRIVRDYLFRNHSVDQTFEMWGSVRKGEERNIFPFQEEADVMFNSSLLYEFSVLKNFAEPLLKGVEEDKPYYLNAQRLLFTLSFFNPITPEMIPRTSVVREFIGGSSFDY